MVDIHFESQNLKSSETNDFDSNTKRVLSVILILLYNNKFLFWVYGYIIIIDC